MPLTHWLGSPAAVVRRMDDGPHLSRRPTPAKNSAASYSWTMRALYSTVNVRPTSPTRSSSANKGWNTDQARRRCARPGRPTVLG